MTTPNLIDKAEELAGRFYRNRFVSWDRLRDYVDIETCGQLDAQPLDVLTDMVERRIKGRSA